MTAKKSTKRGVVYVITNPVWPGYVKIGNANDAVKRLAVYQTGDPTRSYEVAGQYPARDCLSAELRAHSVLAEFRCEGTEWFKVSVVTALRVVELACAI